MCYKGKLLFMVIIVMLGLLTSRCAAQQPIYANNIRYLDSVIQDLKSYLCSDILTYPASYELKKIKEDKMIIRALNKLFQNNATPQEIEADFKRAKRAIFTKKYRRNGLLEINHLTLTGNYFIVQADIEHVNGSIYRKYCSLRTSTHAQCGKSGVTVFDFNLMKRHLLSDISFPIGFMDDAIVTNVFIAKTLEIAVGKYPDYRFNLPKTDKKDFVNRIFTNQYIVDSSCCYNRRTANKDFVALIKIGEIQSVIDLLYSPNYYYSVNAMESLIYLNNINQVSLDDSMKKRMELIKTSDYEMIIKQTNDVFPLVSGYKEIKTNDAEVIQKYRRALQ